MARRKYDWYPTGPWMVEQMLQRVPVAGSVLECCSGADDITNVLRAHPGVTSVATNDVDPSRPSDTHHDARTPSPFLREPATGKTYDWVVTNPPFNQAIEILKAAHASGANCAFLLRLSFLEPVQDRGPWLSENPPDEMLVMPRYSFTGDGNTDSVTCAWMIWYNHGCNSGPEAMLRRGITVVPRGK